MKNISYFVELLEDVRKCDGCDEYLFFYEFWDRNCGVSGQSLFRLWKEEKTRCCTNSND